MSQYFPYLRGKQYELLAVRELNEAGLLPENVFPVIEPVRSPDTGALGRTVRELIDSGRQTTVVINPQVGQLADPTHSEALLDFCSEYVNPDGNLFHDQATTGSLTLGVIVTSSNDISVILRRIADKFGSRAEVDLFHESAGNESISRVENNFVNFKLHLNFAEEKNLLRSYQRNSPVGSIGSSLRSTDVSQWRDYFQRAERSSAYPSEKPYLYTDDNLYIDEDGYAGLSDYQTIGAGYAEGGGLPLAIALHLTYQLPDKKGSDHPVYIVHFVSDSNRDRSDPARKFSEAVGKLSKFCAQNGLSGPGIDALLAHQKNGSYPGLGSLKKLAIQNHICTMSRALLP